MQFVFFLKQKCLVICKIISFIVLLFTVLEIFA